MVALEITSVKNFMNRLLASDAFDIFLLEEAIIKTAATYTIDGYVNKDFFTGEETQEAALSYAFLPWADIKGQCFQLIKGKRTPLLLKLVLQLKPEQADTLLHKADAELDTSSLKSLVLTIKYSGAKVVLTTAASYHTFVMNKEAEQIWDKSLMQYLTKLDIPFEQL